VRDLPAATHEHSGCRPRDLAGPKTCFQGDRSVERLACRKLTLPWKTNAFTAARLGWLGIVRTLQAYLKRSESVERTWAGNSSIHIDDRGRNRLWRMLIHYADVRERDLEKQQAGYQHGTHAHKNNEQIEFG
jgi:hypothetical protein